MNATESKISPQEIRPAHDVISATLLQYPEAPGITFVWPTHPERHGYPENNRGLSIPLVLVTKLVTSDELIAAAERAGRGFGMTQTLRRAAKAWLRSDEAQSWPSRRDGESRDEAVRRVRQVQAEREHRLFEEAKDAAERERAERLAQMTEEERAYVEARDEILDRALAELDALKATREAQPQT